MIDLVLSNGSIHTLDPRLPLVSVLALGRGRIVAAGADAEELRRRMPAARRVDLGGRCVIPGLVDCHVHFAAYAAKLRQVDPETATLDELVDRVSRRAAALPAGSWILGFGWNQNAWGGAFPDSSWLDRAAPAHPVFLRAKSGHAGWANRMAMRLAGVDASTPAPPGGRIQHDPGGSPTGIFLESAQELIERAVPEPDLDDVASAMAAAQEQALRAGLTGVHDLDGPPAMAAWQLLRGRGQQRLRVWKSIPGGLLEQAVELGVRTGLGDAWLRVGGVKLFADGALGPRTAWMLDPYEQDGANLGLPAAGAERLPEVVQRAASAGLAVLVHAIGDRANRRVLDMFAALRGTDRPSAPGLRHRIEHAQLLHSTDAPRLAALGLVASMQPVQATSDMAVVDRYWGQRGEGAYAFRTLLERGTRLAFGSDAPVETIAPLAGIHAAVTRCAADGRPGPAGWYPRQRLSVAEAVHGYTLGAAWAAGEEADRGSLSPGKLADLVVLDRDIFAGPPSAIAQTRVLGTMVDGAWAYLDDAFDPGS